MTDPFTLGTGAIGAVKTAFDLTKAFVDVRDATKVQSLKFELMGLLLEAQEAQAASLGRIRSLEQQIAQFDEWESQKKDYELKAVGPGAFVYVQKGGAESGQPTPWYCQPCFENRKKSIYQKLPGSSAQSQLRIPTTYECSVCKSKIAP